MRRGDQYPVVQDMARRQRTCIGACVRVQLSLGWVGPEPEGGDASILVMATACPASCLFRARRPPARAHAYPHHFLVDLGDPREYSRPANCKLLRGWDVAALQDRSRGPVVQRVGVETRVSRLK